MTSQDTQGTEANATMPQRTNDFQELVSLIQRSLAKDGETVSDSEMVRVQGLETEREIDILHTIPTGLSVIKVAVEAKDEGRPFDVTKLESLIAKYRGEGRVCVDKFIVVSRNGFTKGATEKAELLDIPLYSLDEAKELDWSAVASGKSEFPQVKELNVHFPAHFHRITIMPPLPADREQAILKEGRISCVHGHDHGSLKEYINKWAFGRNDAERARTRQLLEEKARIYPKGGLATPSWEVEGYTIRHGGREYPFKGVTAEIHLVKSTVPVTCNTYKMESADGKTHLVQHVSGNWGDTPIQWVMTKTNGIPSKKLAMKVGKTPKPERKNAKERAEERKKKSKAEKKRMK